MARDVADLRLMFQVLTDQPVTLLPRKVGLKGRRIGIWAEDKAFAVSNTCTAAVEIAAEAAAEAGAQVLVAKPDVDGNEIGQHRIIGRADSEVERATEARG